MRITICDDVEARRDTWRDELQSLLGDEHKVDSFRDFDEQFAALNHRRETARQRRGASDERVPLAELPQGDEVDALDIDDVDVLVVDYDLFNYDPNAYLTGAIVAYLVRCYSRCRFVVGVNETGPNPFDLTLADHPSSFADVLVGEKQLLNPALWGAGREAFRPWSWPCIPDAVERHRRRCEQVATALEEPIIDVVGLSGAVDLLPRSAVAHLERAGVPEARTSMDELARGPRLGLRRGDEALSHEALTRIASARAAKWLEAVVLPLQDVVADAPHIAARNPLLLAGDADQESSWQATTSVPGGHDASGLDHEHLAAHQHAPDHWLSRPAWYWHTLSNDSEIPGVARPWEISPAQVVFCEDVSEFVPQEQARRFVSALDSRSPSRWVADSAHERWRELQEVDYVPVARLAL